MFDCVFLNSFYIFIYIHLFFLFIIFINHLVCIFLLEGYNLHNLDHLLQILCNQLVNQKNRKDFCSYFLCLLQKDFCIFTRRELFFYLETSQLLQVDHFQNLYPYPQMAVNELPQFLLHKYISVVMHNYCFGNRLNVPKDLKLIFSPHQLLFFFFVFFHNFINRLPPLSKCHPIITELNLMNNN